MLLLAFSRCWPAAGWHDAGSALAGWLHTSPYLTHPSQRPATQRAVAGLRDLRLSTLCLSGPQLSAVLQHTQLTRLWLLQACVGYALSGSQPQADLAPSPASCGGPRLPNLCSLFWGFDRGFDHQCRQLLETLASPGRLTYLGLVGCRAELPACLPTFTALEALNASANADAEQAYPLYGLEHLAGLGAAL